jgi:hypothetical protein
MVTMVSAVVSRRACASTGGGNQIWQRIVTFSSPILTWILGIKFKAM